MLLRVLSPVCLLVAALLMVPAQTMPAPATPGLADTSTDAPPGHAANADPAADAVAAAQAAQTVRFEPNRGQEAASILYIARSADAMALLEADAITFLAAAVPALGSGEPPTPEAVRIQFSGRAESVTPAGVTGAVSHHYLGNAPHEQLRDVPHYRSVRYNSLLPGVDLVVYGTPEGRIEFDHVVAPGADASAAGFSVHGATPRLDSGDLLLGAQDVTFRLAAPYAYQERDGHRVTVPSSFRLDGQHVSYALGPHDPSLPLVIDPVVKTSSYLGTSSSEYGYGIQVLPGPTSSSRHVYIGGYASSGLNTPAGFPTPTTHGSGGSSQAYVAKFLYDRGTNAATPLWYAYIGGSSSELAYDIAVNAAGDVGVTGYTSSTVFPTPNAITQSGNQGNTDAFVFVLDANGGAVFGSYLGGQGSDYGYGVAFGPGGHLLATGYSFSSSSTPDFPTLNAPQPSRAGGTEAWALKIDLATTPATLVFSTFIGGTGSDYGRGIGEVAGGVLVGGYTYSGSSFPTTAGAYQPTPQGGSAGYVVSIPSNGGPSFNEATLVDFSSSTDLAYDMAVDAGGRPWLTGYTYSSNIPTSATAPQSSYTCCSAEAYAVALNPSLTALSYATYLGGTNSDYGYSIAFDGLGNTLVSGYTRSTSGFPLMGAAQTTHGGGGADVFIVRLDTTGAQDFGTYLGGTGSDYGDAIAGGPSGDIFATGRTLSSNFPTVAANQASSGGSYDAFLTVFGKDTPHPVITATAPGYPGMDTPDGPYQVLTLETITVDGLNSTDGAFPVDHSLDEWTLTMPDGTVQTATGTLTPTFSPAITYSDNKTATVCLTLTDTDPDPSDRTATACMDLEWLNRPPTASIDVFPTPVQMASSVTFTGSGIDLDGTIADHEWTLDGVTANGATATLPTPATPGFYPVTFTVTDDDGATDTKTQQVKVVDGPIVDFTWPDATYIAGQDIVPFEDLTVAGAQPIQWYQWAFGDGDVEVFGPSPPTVVGHLFALPGTYEVTLTAYDGVIEATKTKTITILPDAVTPIDDAYSTFMDSDITVPAPGVLANDLQPYASPLSVVSYTHPIDNAGQSVGTVTMDSDGSFVFSPADGFLGTATFEYVANDTYTDSAPGIVAIEVTMYPPPNALFDVNVAGRQVLFTDQSFPGHWPIATWTWQFGDGGVSADQHPVHEYEGHGTYTVTLTVTDTFGLPSTTTRSVFIIGVDHHPLEPGSDPPEAVPGDATAVRAGDTVVLDARGSRGGDLSYSWQQVSGPPVQLQGADTDRPSFVAPATGDETLVFELRVHNGVEFSAAATVAVLVQAVDQPPVAHVDPLLLTVAPGETVTFDGARSYDPEDEPLTYTWRQVSGPDVALPAGPQVLFTAPDVDETTSIVFELIVNDGVHDSEPRQAEVRVEPSSRLIRASFEAAPAGGLAWRFEDTSVAPEPLSYWWDFGDGSPINHQRSPTHTFAPGEYLVTLKVTDGKGQWSTFGRHITVEMQSEPIAPAVQPAAVADAHEAVRRESPLPLGIVLVGLLALLGVRRR